MAVTMDFIEVKTQLCMAESYAELKREYEKYRDMPLNELTRELFDIFYETGSREEYEKEYFKRRGALLASALMYLISGEEESLEVLVRTIDKICGEFTWALPAHVERDDPHPEEMIDLFSAETSEALSEICARLGSKLPQSAYKKIRGELERRIVTPFKRNTYNWEKMMTNNWAAVCAGSVGMTFLYMFPEKFAEIEPRINKSLENYLSGFGDDGICPEGLSYWNYGFWYFTAFADLYKEKCGVDLINSPKIKSIAECQQEMFLKGNTVISYSDGGRSGQFNSGLAHYYRKIFGSDVKITNGKITAWIDGCYRFAAATRSILWADEKLYGMCETQDGEKYFADCQWYVNRKEKFDFTAKCGNNNESHNHNDIGSFIISSEGGQLLADYGSGEYTKDYFAEGRYNYLCNSSRGHSLPIIDGKYQCAGEKYFGKVIKHGHDSFVIDISGAYDVAELTRAERRFSIGEDFVEVSDSFEFSDNAEHEITERFVSVIKPEAADGRIYIGNVSIECDELLEIKAEGLKDHKAKDDVLYLIDGKCTDEFKIRFQF